jgi:hypothetical protein
VDLAGDAENNTKRQLSPVTGDNRVGDDIFEE